MYYGFDMGGTKIELMVFNQQLQQVWNKRLPTPKNDYQALLQSFIDLTQEADARFAVEGKIGVGVPGIVNLSDGTVFTTNVPAAKGKPLLFDLQRCLNRNVKMDNDANCFALSEAWDAEFRQYPSVLGLILGTGVGGGLIINGRSFAGLNGICGEIGHLRLPVDALNLLGKDIPLLPCGCGKNGCIEGYISGRGFEWLYQHYYQQSLSAPDIIQRYVSNEPHATEHVDRYLELLAIYVGNILTMFDPHLLVIGGGLSNFDEIYQQLPKRLPKHLYAIARLPKIAKAKYGDSGGGRGAAFLNL